MKVYEVRVVKQLEYQNAEGKWRVTDSVRSNLFHELNDAKEYFSYVAKGINSSSDSSIKESPVNIGDKHRYQAFSHGIYDYNANNDYECLSVEVNLYTRDVE